MKDTVIVFGKEFEYDFLSGWIKYNRIQKEISQEALCFGICSVSHLSYFENCKKTLRGDIIEALLKKLDICKIEEIKNLGLLRQKFYNLTQYIENLNYEGAKLIYEDLLKVENLIQSTPYSIEYKVYTLIYNFFVLNLPYSQIKHDLISLDKICETLNDELKYLYLLISGRILYKYTDHEEGIRRMLKAQKIKETPWLQYLLGFSYHFNEETLKGVYYLEKALETYEASGKYINALWCHNYLGISYIKLKLYDKAELHLKAALTGAEYFNMDSIFFHLYTNLSHFYLCKKEYSQCIKYSKLAMDCDGDIVLPVCNCIEAYLKMNQLEKCKDLFDLYLNQENVKSRYYNWLLFLYLYIFHFDEEVFYQTTVETVLPFYKSINYISFCEDIALKLIEYLENKRKYKEANKLYRELLHL